MNDSSKSDEERARAALEAMDEDTLHEMAEFLEALAKKYPRIHPDTQVEPIRKNGNCSKK